MARQVGTIKLSGTIDDLVFYVMNGVGYVRRTTGRKIKVSIRTKENATEFGAVATVGAFFRRVLRPILIRCRDKGMHNRVSAALFKIKRLDDVSKRGERSAITQLKSQKAKEILIGIDFNRRSIMKSVLYKKFTFEEKTESLTLKNLDPKEDVVFPKGATHVGFEAAHAKIDFVNKDSYLRKSNRIILNRNDKPSSVHLVFSEQDAEKRGRAQNTIKEPFAPDASPIEMIVLKVSFWKMRNGQLERYKGEVLDSVKIVRISYEL